MAHQQKPRPAQDPYARRLKALDSAVRRLRGWTGSDPSRRPELLDALVELTAHRLLGHRYLEAASEAQEAVKLAAEVMLSSGPVGPYTRPEDATRCGTAMIHLAAVQIGLRLPDAAGRMIDSWEELRRQLEAVDLRPPLAPSTVLRALISTARVALAAGDVATANAYADAARDRLAVTELDAEDYQPIDVLQLSADTRWAAGRPEESLGLSHAARERYDALVAGRLDEPGRYPPALVERLSESLFVIYRDLADRLRHRGEVDLGLVARRRLIDLLGGLANRQGEQARESLAAALTDLASDLLAAGRIEESTLAAEEAAASAADRSVGPGVRLLATTVSAQVLLASDRTEEAIKLLSSRLAADEDAADASRAVAQLVLAEAARQQGDSDGAAILVGQAAELAPDHPWDRARRVVPVGGESIDWQPLSPSAAYLPDESAAVGTSVETVDRTDTAEWLAAERASAARAEEQRNERARVQAESRRQAEAETERREAERTAAERAAREADARREAERRAALEAEEASERRRRREARLREHQALEEQRAGEVRAERRAEIEHRIAQLIAADPAEVSAELDRLRAELAELARAEAESEARLGELSEPDVPDVPDAAGAPSAADVTEVPEAEPAPAAESAVEPEPAFAPTPEPEPISESAPKSAPASEPVPEPDELDRARTEVAAARTAGDRKRSRAALDALVGLLRPRVETDIAGYGFELRTALEELSRARLRGGDLFGSRAASKEAKALDKRLGG